MVEFLDLQTLLLLALVALSAGFIDAIAGGGGMLTVPALLAIGLPPHLALGTNKLAATFASSTAAFTYFRKKLFTPSFWRHAGLGTFIGAIFGTLSLKLINTSWLEKLLPLIIIGVAFYTLLHPSTKKRSHQLPPQDKNLIKTQWKQGISLGFYDGILGPGTGAFWTLSSMSLDKVDILLASGLARAMNFISNITSMVTFIALGYVNWKIGLIMGVCLMLGAYLGAHSAIKFGAPFIRPVFISAVIALALKLAFDAWF